MTKHFPHHIQTACFVPPRLGPPGGAETTEPLQELMLLRRVCRSGGRPLCDLSPAALRLLVLAGLGAAFPASSVWTPVGAGTLIGDCPPRKEAPCQPSPASSDSPPSPLRRRGLPGGALGNAGAFGEPWPSPAQPAPLPRGCRSTRACGVSLKTWLVSRPIETLEERAPV